MSTDSPAGGAQLLCPKGPAYSMLSDLEFKAIQDDDYIHLAEISRSAWGNWYSNGKVIKLTHRASSSDAGILENTSYNVTQWKFKIGVATYENLGPHPYSRTTGSSNALRNLMYFTPFSDWAYRTKGDGRVPIITSPLYMFFIHRDKFYAAIAHQMDPTRLSKVSYTDDKVDMEYIYTIGTEIFTVNFIREITERFYS